MEPLEHFHTPLPNYSIFDNPNRQEDLVKIIVQTLDDLGYKKSAEKLIEESNVKLENPVLLSLRAHVSEGNWDEAVTTLDCLHLSKEHYDIAQFLLYEQKYIELIIAKQYNEALLLLRDEVTRKCTEPERLHKLAGLMMCLNVKDIEAKLNKSAEIAQARRNMLKELQERCKPKNMMIANRFEKLIKQAVCFQVINCKYHKGVQEDFSLLQDHFCELEPFPSHSVKIVEQHSEEVWMVKFSSSGDLLASISRNMELIVWDFDSTTLSTKMKFKKQKIHAREVHCLNWSRDDNHLLTTSSDQTIKIWNASNGNLKLTLKAHLDIICSAVWLPDNKHFISGGIDNHLIIWNMQGEKTAQIRSPRISDLLVASRGKVVYAVCAGACQVSVIDLVKKAEKHQIKERAKICSAVLSKDNQFLLLNTSFDSPELHLWSLENYELVQVYTGHVQRKFKIFCCTGGFDDQFIACGGEDGCIRIWHRNCSEPLVVLRGHTSTVNSVTWHPKDPHIMVSGSDDHTLRIWTSDKIETGSQTKVNRSQDASMEVADEEAQLFLDEIPRKFRNKFKL